MQGQTTGDQIVRAADQLFYRQGYGHTSFSDIAEAVHISRGNFYYHFKSKDAILGAVIDLRLANTRAMLAAWEAAGDGPLDCLRSFVDMLVMNRKEITRYGCPVGTLSTELAKLGSGAGPEANRLFMLFRTWLGQQFTRLGRGAEADRLAMHLLARSQGVATLANAFQDEAFIRQEVALMHDWLSACAPAAD